MRIALIVLALVAMMAAAASAQLITNNNFQYFPLNAGRDGKDGTYVWTTVYSTQLQAANVYPNAITSSLCGSSSRFGSYQFDYKCRNAGPSNSRAIVCTSGQGCVAGSSTPGRSCTYPGYDDLCGVTGASVNPRSADSYLQYGRTGTGTTTGSGRFVGPTGSQVFQRVKPVWAFDLYRAPAPAWIKIANSVEELFQVGVNRALALTQSSGTSTSAPSGSSPFSFFFINAANPNQGVTTSSTEPYNNIVDIPTNMAWTGCGAINVASAGGSQVLPSQTCLDWTYASRDFTVAIGIQGNPGYVPYTSASYVTDWLNNGRSTPLQYPPYSSSGTGAPMACNMAGQYIYCSWQPQNNDGIQNGDETGIDCGGTTMGELASGLPTPNCTCAPGYYQLYTYGACTPCPVNTYCRLSGGCGTTGCNPCASAGTTVNTNGVALTGQIQCVCRSGYQYPTGFNPAVTGIYDGSYCQLIVRGDPQITGLQGQDFQVHGIPDEFFNMISHPELQVNARFVYLEDAKCDNFTTCFTHAGTYIDQIGIMTADGDKVKVLAGSLEAGLRVFVNGKEIKVGTKQSLKNLKIHFSHQRKVHIRTPLFALAFLNSDMFMNQEVALLDMKLAKLGSKQVSLKAGTERPHQEVPLHGIVGQTWQNIKYPEGMFIEGAVADYRIEESELFGTGFVYNQFAPRVDIVA